MDIEHHAIVPMPIHDWSNLTLSVTIVGHLADEDVWISKRGAQNVSRFKRCLSASEAIRIAKNTWLSQPSRAQPNALVSERLVMSRRKYYAGSLDLAGFSGLISTGGTIVFKLRTIQFHNAKDLSMCVFCKLFKSLISCVQKKHCQEVRFNPPYGEAVSLQEHFVADGLSYRVFHVTLNCKLPNRAMLHLGHTPQSNKMLN